jgi:H+-transporting ATPase
MQVLFLAGGLIMTGQAILTPMLMVLMMMTGDFLAMSSSTDNVRASPTPGVWKIGPLTVAGVIMGLFDLLFCVTCFATGKYLLDLDTGTLRTLAVVIACLFVAAMVLAVVLDVVKLVIFRQLKIA